MQIRDMFLKPIDREIRGVIKVGQAEEENVKQELEEYVVTGELRKRFEEFFSSYKKGIIGTTDAIGVWISGFFGSGKSHFLKILSYLLGNRLVDGKHALDYFTDDHKISEQDGFLLADMRLASTVPTDVILFNIGSMSDASSASGKDTIVSVFLRAFNEHLGYCGTNHHLAGLERHLSERGEYARFKQEFERAVGEPWEAKRDEFYFIQDDLVDVLSGMGFMSVEAARNWCEKASGDYSIAIQDFAKLVQKHIKACGKNHHVVFLVDEVGQYIGEDANLMLDLQTVTEDLGRYCGGKAWVIVTSQQDIDSITKVRGNDFSKIKGRFDTNISLTSADVAEVIRERILRKNEAGRQTLSILYGDKETVLKNLILFNDGVERKVYTGAENFTNVYPFVSYQFDLLGEVLTAVRTYGASGKHLSEGERSMLAMFKEAAVRLKEREQGALAPFHLFYDSLERHIEPSHSSVITRALTRDALNPDHAGESFDVNVLKLLYLVKYIKGFRANAEQLTSLMVSSVDDDRLELKQRVEVALMRLEKQMLIQQNGETYVFLTNEEQEINRAIDRQSIERSDLTNEVSKIIFADIYAENKYRYPAHGGRYQFAFNQQTDERPYRPNQNYPLTLRVITPDSDISRDEATLLMTSSQSRVVLVVLPEDRTFLDELTKALKIDRFIRFEAGNTAARYAEIKNSKQTEAQERRRMAKADLEEALREAAIYVLGSKLASSSKDIKSRINDGLSRLVASTYNKLNYITYPASDGDIRALLRRDDRQITLNAGTSQANENALNDVSAYIAGHTDPNGPSSRKISMKSLLDRFTSAPYGFIDADVQYLVTKLFVGGDIALFVNNEPITLLSRSEDEIFRIITRREYVERLMLERRERATENQKRAVREVMRELFEATPPSDDDEAMMRSFLSHARSYSEELARMELRYQTQPRYPGRKVIAEAKALMSAVRAMNYTGEFYAHMDRERERFLDLAEDMEPVKRFFDGEQKAIFDRALLFMGYYEASKNYIADEALSALAGQINEILRMSAPYRRIVELPGLCLEFQEKYDAILNSLLEPAKEAISEARARVVDALEGKRCRAKLADRFARSFDELKEKAERTNSVADLQNIRHEADAMKLNMLNRIEREEAALTPQPPVKDPDKPQPIVKRKQTRSVSIKAITRTATWRIETEADVDSHLAELRERLMGMLKDGTIYHIEF